VTGRGAQAGPRCRPACSGDPVRARLTGTNALVTLVFTMRGLTRRNFKISMLLLAATLALALGWSYVPHLLFGILLACMAICALSVALSRDAWRQAHRIEPPPPRARPMTAPPRTTSPTRPIFSLLGIDE
jgi:MFS superfamily sulfate permease-like transporter